MARTKDLIAGLLGPENVATAVTRLAIDAIDPDPEQPRRVWDEQGIQELASSMRALGQLQPVVVRQDGARYRLVAGERRWRAAKRLGWVEIEARVIEESVPALLAQVAENTLRENLHPQDLLRAIDRLYQMKFDTNTIAEAFGVSPRTIQRYKRVLRDPEAVVLLEMGASLRSVMEKQQQKEAKETRGVAASDGAVDAGAEEAGEQGSVTVEPEGQESRGEVPEGQGLKDQEQAEGVVAPPSGGDHPAPGGASLVVEVDGPAGGSPVAPEAATAGSWGGSECQRRPGRTTAFVGG